MKKGFTLIELLSVIIILAVISVIAYPKILDVIESSKISAFSSSKKLIIDSAKNKYLADATNANVTEYKVVDLIEDGYIQKGAKNPLTGKEYNDDAKVLITNEDGNINFYYIDGETLISKIQNLNEENGLYKENDGYIYKGKNAKNYISFNEEIYRIIKVDDNGYIYILKNDCNNLIEKNNVSENLQTMYNDEYIESVKKMIQENIGLLTRNLYENSIIDGGTYITNGNDMWISDGTEYKILTSDTNEMINSDNNSKACTKIVLKLKNYLVIENGEGTQFNPYIVNMKKY